MTQAGELQVCGRNVIICSLALVLESTDYDHVSVSSDNFLQHGQLEHGHPPDKLKIETRKNLNRLRKAAQESPREVSSAFIASKMVAEVHSEAVRGALPNFRLLRNQVYYARRQKEASGVKRAKNRENLEISESEKVGKRRNSFRNLYCT